MNRKLMSVLLMASVLVTGCDAFPSAPTYGALSIAGFNRSEEHTSELQSH